MLKKNIIKIILISIVFIACKDSAEQTRYQSIQIPEYTEADYNKLLYSFNNEIVYNAICNLTYSAHDFASILSNDTIDKNSKDYILAKNTYERVTRLLKSNDRWIIGSSICFLNEFGSAYNNKQEIIDKIIKVRNKSKNIQLELALTISNLCDSGTIIKKKQIDKFLNSNSWIVSRAAYGIISKTKNKDLLTELHKSYYHVVEEYDKLLILNALCVDFDKSVADLLFSEIVKNENKKIRSFIFKNLLNAKDKSIINAWINENYNNLCDEDVEIIARSNFNLSKTPYGVELFKTLQKTNYYFNPKPEMSACDSFLVKTFPQKE